MARTGPTVVAVLILAVTLASAASDNSRSRVLSTGEEASVESALLTIPQSQLPRAGECRIWTPGRSMSSQRPPGRCAALMRDVPPGSWLIQRPTWDRRHFRVEVYHPTRPGVPVAVRLYEADTRLFVGEREPGGY